MKRFKGLVAAIVLALAPPLLGGTLSAAPPPNGGTIAIEPKTADGEYDPSLHVFAEAASEALSAKGFTVLDPTMHTAYIAELTLSRAAVGTGLAKDPGGASVGVAGTGLVVPFSTGRSNVTTLQRTRMELRIRKAGEQSSVWEGAAVTVRATGTRKGADETVASDLSGALFSGYPAAPTEVVGVP